MSYEQSEPKYWLKCDDCGVKSAGAPSMAMRDKIAFDSGWRHTRGFSEGWKHFCHACWKQRQEAAAKGKESK